MPATRRTSPRARAVSRPVSLVVTVVLAVCTAACTEGGGPTPPAPPEPVASTPLSAYDVDGPGLAPGDPCTGLTQDVVADALGGATVEASVAWAPGQRLPGTSEVADEHGCRHTAGDVTASAWVFAVPTSPAQARRLVAEATAGKCRRARGAETFGDPGVAFTCRLNAGDPLTGMRGLVGTSWVSCEILGTDDLERVGRWCGAVLQTLSDG